MAFILGLIIFVALAKILFKPLMKWLVKSMVRRQFRKMQQEAERQSKGPTPGPENHSRRKEGWDQSTSTHRKKKIAPDVGEYVSYEIISEERLTATYQEMRSPEPRISDADWEDIK